MNIRRWIPVLLTIVFVMTTFASTGFAESEDQPGGQSAGIQALDAKETNAAGYYTVEFKDWDGSPIGDPQMVAQGADAQAPVHPTRDGYEPNGWDKPFTNVQSDLVVTALYKQLETYTLTINYLFEDNGVAAQPYIATVKNGESFDYDVNSPSVAGFHPDQTNVSGTLDGADVTVTVIYLPNGATSYTVNYYTENLDGSTYALDHSKTLSGLTGTLVTAAADAIEGFTPPATMPSGRISADGNMTLAVYYTRNVYTVYFVTDGTYIDPISYKYGAAVAAWPAAPVRTGYTFTGWDTTKPAMMPANDIKVTAQWTANKSTNYTLVYWLENITGAGYDYVGAAVRTGTTGTAPTIPGSIPSGVSFPIGSSYRTYDSAKTTMEMPAAIKGDGTTIVNVYYSRNTYTITFKLNGGNMAIDGVTYNDSRDYTITAKFGAYIGDQWPAASPAKSGTTFTGWQRSEGTKYVTRQYYMDTELSGTTLNAQYGRSKQVTIYYYFENLTGNTSGTPLGGRYYSEDTAYRQTVNTDRNTNSWSAKTFDGFSILSGYSSVDLVNNTATFYYTRSSYTLSFYSSGSLVNSANHQYGTAITAAATPANGPAGYTFAGWYLNQNGYGSPYTFGTMPAYNLILYAKWTPIVYTVTFDSQSGSAVDAQHVENGGQATEPTAPTRAGYTFAYWYLASENIQFVFDREIHSSITLLAKWIPSTNITYTIKYQNGDGTDLFAPETVTGQMMGSTVYAEAKPKEGYLPDKVSKSITLEADNNAIVFTYTPFTTIDYTVRHVAADGSFDTSSTVATSHAVVTENYVNHPGYSPDAYQKTLMLSLDTSANVITFHYTKNADKAYTVRHYQQNLNTSGYTLADTETLYGPVGYKARASAKSYTGFSYNASISNAFGTITSDGLLILNLYYDRITYSLTYNANGGSGSMAKQSGKYQNMVTVAANGFAKENYVFTGWKTQANGGNAYSAGDPLTLTGDVTLYAQWQEKAKYTVSYNANGGTGTMNDPQSPYYDGTSFTVKTNSFSAPANKHFTGWNDAANGSGTAYAAGSPYVIAGNVTLYAQWAYNSQYTVTYYGNGGTGAVLDSSSPYYDGNTVTVKDNGFTYFGYEFIGWNTVPDGSGTAYAAGDTFSISDDTELFARWSKDPALWYTVAYNGNGNTGGIVPADSAEYLQNTTVTVKAGVPTKTNAVFLGWSTTRHAPVTTQAQADAVVFAGSTFIIMNDTTLYAVWAEDKNGPNGGQDGTPDYQQYGLAYDANSATGGSVPVNSNIYTPGTSVSVAGNTGGLVRTNAVFIGWSATQAALITKAADVPTPLYVSGNSISMVTGGITLYAVWAEDKNGPAGGSDGVPDYLEFSVTYDKNGADATGTVTDSNLYPDNYTVTVKSNGFTHTNYVFDHWNTASDDSGTSVAAGGTFKIHSNMTFHAIWELDANGPDGGPDGIPDKIEYSVLYDANGGDVASVPVDNHIYPKDYSVPLKFSPVPARSGYDFLGWAESQTSATPVYTSAGTTNLKMGTGDVTLYAVWTPHVYNITYELQGGTNNADNPSKYTVESAAVTLKDPTKPGYNFTGWTPGNSIPAGSTGDKTFTATWSNAIEYNINYVLNGGSVSGTNPPKYTAESGDITLINPVLEGYAFTGWTGTGLTLPTMTVTIPTGSTGDRTYTATYAQNAYTGSGYTVTFVDYDGTVLGADGVLYGEAATAPADPTRNGYRFTGWDVPFNYVTESLTVTAQYAINRYTVRFVDFDGAVLSEQTVNWNAAATAPADPARDGYTFDGWDVPFDHVTSDLIVTATYKEVVVVEQGGEDIPQMEANGNQTIEDEPIPAGSPQRDLNLNWLWWLLLIPLLLLLLLFLLLYNVSVMVYGRDGKGQEKLLRTIRRLKSKKDEVIVSLKNRHVADGIDGMVELTKGFTKRMRGNRLTIEVEGANVLSVVIPDDADEKFQARIEKWIVL